SGLSCAAALAARGFRVTVLESRQRLGGRAGAFTDPPTGQLVDACPHVRLGGCTKPPHLPATGGVGHFPAAHTPRPLLTPHPRARPGAVCTPARGRPPAPRGRALLGAHSPPPVEKRGVAGGMLALGGARRDAAPPLLDWLFAHRQTRRTVDRFWGVVLVSALN